MVRAKRRPRRYTTASRILSRYVRRVKARRNRRMRYKKAARRVGKLSYYRVLNRAKKSNMITVQRTVARAWSYNGTDGEQWRQWKFQVNYDASSNPVGLLGWAQYAALYRFHKVVGIKLTWTVREVFGGEDVLGNFVNFPTIYVTSFYETDSEPTDENYNRISQMQNLRSFTFSAERSYFEHRIFPKILDRGTYDSSAVYDVYSPRKCRWFDNDYPYAWYYGVLWYMPNLADPVVIDVAIEWTVKFKCPRTVDPVPGSALMAAAVEGQVFDEMTATIKA